MPSGRPKIYLLAMLVITLAFGCSDDECCDETPTGRITLSFLHYNNGSPLITDTLTYLNAAGNLYIVSEIQYFISDLVLRKEDGTAILLNHWKDIHYVDTDLENTWDWKVFDEIPEGRYSQVGFTFGINEEKNQSMMFVNPPESLMFWPEYLGGGYHYMKLNGKWRDPEGIVKPFNFHLGIGQNYDQEGNVTGFIQNFFTIVIDAYVMIEKDSETKVSLIMNVDQWFEHPHIYDHNVWGGDIMQKQAAMQQGLENGWNVFTIAEQ